MSCNGCRVLRKGCSDKCVLRTCLQWIPSPEGQGNATLFLIRFFGRNNLLSLVASVPESQRSVLFQSLLFEACGRKMNPIYGAVGLLSTGNWHVCQAAVDTVLSSGALQPLPVILGSLAQPENEYSSSTCRGQKTLLHQFVAATSDQSDPDCSLGLNSMTKFSGKRWGKRNHFMENWPIKTASSLSSDGLEVATVESSGGGGSGGVKLLNLFI